jgi:hypothetical protein
MADPPVEVIKIHHSLREDRLGREVSREKNPPVSPFFGSL